MTRLPPPRLRKAAWRECLRGLRRSALLAVALSAAAVVGIPSAAAATTAAAAEPGAPSVAFLWADINGSNSSVSAAIMSRSVRARFLFEARSSTDEASPARLTARLQQRVGDTGRWADTGQTFTTVSTTFDVRIRPYSLDPMTPDVTVFYRLLAVTGRAPRAGDASPPVRFDYQNWHRYSSLKRALYADMSAFCPDLAIRTGDHELQVNRWAGVTPRGLYETSIARGVGRYKQADQRSVMLHECAHHLQWQNYGATSVGWMRMQQEAAEVFGTNHEKPVEHMADCAAQAANPGGYLGYGGHCTATQLRAAQSILGIVPDQPRLPSLTQPVARPPDLVPLAVGLAAVCIGLLALLVALGVIRAIRRRPSKAALADVRMRVAALAAERPAGQAVPTLETDEPIRSQRFSVNPVSADGADRPAAL